MQELRRREPPQNPRPVADKPRSRQREKGGIRSGETGQGSGLGDDIPGSSVEGNHAVCYLAGWTDVSSVNTCPGHCGTPTASETR